TTPIPTTGGGHPFKDLDVSSLNIVVTGDFFILLQQYPVSGSQNFCTDSGPSVGRSYTGDTLSNLALYPLAGNILIRAVVKPQWNATSTTAMSSSSVAGVSDITGTLLQNSLLIGAIIVLVALLAAVTLRRRKPSGPAT